MKLIQQVAWGLWTCLLAATLAGCGSPSSGTGESTTPTAASTGSQQSARGSLAPARRDELERAGMAFEMSSEGERIVGLKLGQAQVSLDDWNSLIDALPDLQTLDVAESPHVRDNMLDAVRRLPKLRRVRLSRTRLSDVGIAHLANASQLEQLEIQGCDHATSLGLAHLTGLKKLKDLKLGGEMFENVALDPVAQMTGLRILGLDDTPITDLAALAPRADLERLSVVRARVTGAGLTVLPKLAQLQQLRLRGTPIDDDALESVGQCKLLKALDLSETAVGDAGIARLAGLAELEDLNLWKTKVTSQGLAPLQGMKGLKRLNLDDDLEVEDQGIAYLAGLEKLEFLHLGDTRVTDQGLESLHGLKNLKELILTSCPHVTKEGIAKLKQQLPNARIRE